jgi:hypothetical protein
MATKKHANDQAQEEIPIRLIVTPIDPDAPGSFALTRRMRRLMQQVQAADPQKDSQRLLELNDELEQFVIEGCHTSDGSPVEDALAQLSMNEFNRLIAGRITGGGVPLSETPSPSSSTPG